MGNRTKRLLIIAASLVLVGCIIFTGIMAALQWDFTKLSSAEYETSRYQIKESFRNIRIAVDTADITFVPSDNSEASVVCHEQKNMKHLVTVEDNTLVIEIVDTRKWYEYIGINFSTPKITVSLPQGEYGTLLAESDTGDVEIPKEFTFESIDISESTGNVKNYASASEVIKIKTSTGSICVENVSANMLDLSASTGEITASKLTCEGDVKIDVSTGKTNLSHIKCASVIARGSTGDISLKNVVASEKFSIERSTGDVKFDSCDAGEIFVETDTGDVTGSLLTDKMFFAETDTGRVDVPKSTAGGRCEITTDTGDIKITVE